MTTNTPIGILYTHTPLGINEIKHVYIERGSLRMKALMEKLEGLLEIGGTKKDIAFLAVSAVALLCSIFHVVSLPFQLDMAWVAIILCGVPIILEAIIGILNPVAGALVHNSGSVLVIINSFFVLRYQWKNENK